jgi:lipid-A-disaccharide synthase-like uncharacterized protein
MAHLFLAANWFTQEHLFLGLHWSCLKIIGFLGQGVFSMRFLVQWIESERNGRSVLPISFWHWSIAGSLIMCAYWILEREPVGILAYLPNAFIYWRNLRLIRRNRAPITAIVGESKSA